MPRLGEPFASFTGSFGGIVTFNWAPSPILVAQDIEAGARYLNNMSLPLMAARDIGIEDVRENFEGEHDPDGVPWEPWSPSYAESGQTGIGILKRTMDLMGSSTSTSAWPITARELFFSFGALPEYGIYHQTGAERRSAGKGISRAKALELESLASRAGFAEGVDYSNTLPARPFAGISVESQFKIIDIFDAWFGGAIGLAVGRSGAIQTRGPGGRFGPSVVDFTP